MRGFRFGSVLAAGLLLVSPLATTVALAQQRTDSQTRPQTSPPGNSTGTNGLPNDPIRASRREATYRLQPEDVVRIRVFGRQDLNDDVPVARDGNIAAPFVGTVAAAGKTTAELESDLYELFVKKLRLRNPIVSVTITRFRELRASVGGFVGRPGQFPIRPGDSIITLLNQGGGPIPDRADLRRATLRRSGSNELIPVDLYAMLIQGDTSQNFEVQDGDELNIPEETVNRVLVLGAVQRQGYYPYKEPMTLADAIALAGGEIPTRTRFSRTEIIRRKIGDPTQFVRIKADFVAFVKKGDSSQNVVLRPGDIISIPTTNTPDLTTVNQLVNTIFVLDSLGGLFGFRLRR